MVVYFCYGINHSLANTETDNRRQRYSRTERRERPDSLMLSTVQMSRIPTDLAPSGAASNTPTFDLSTFSIGEERYIHRNGQSFSERRSERALILSERERRSKFQI